MSGDLSVFIYSETGATKTCRYCGTHYDLHGVAEDELPPVGDGCEHCDPDDWEEELL